MQSTSTMFGVSFKKNPRIGQKRVLEKIHKDKPKKLNIKLPTGYGKTITATGSYSILKKLGLVNRLLFIFPTNTQLNQFVNDGHNDLKDVGITDKLSIIDVRFFGLNSLKKSINNEAQVFCITVQALIQSNGDALITALMEKNRWMVIVDEYHHYGIDTSWGDSVINLPYEHLLAMSATPNRPKEDSAFGKPDMEVKYMDAYGEGAVKPLYGHSYNYRVDAVDTNGDVMSFTTDELVEEAGGESPEKITKFVATKKMRWSPKYISPLVSVPIERMIANRIISGYKLQAIVGAMCVSHAELVCKQVKDIFPELSIDWVGTGDDGKTNEDNKKILDKFCPKKDGNGIRKPTLDVLVHVGMAGEGLDSVLVSEVIHLNKASKNNSNDQENGRASRWLDGVVGNINFDSSSDYAKYGYIGEKIMYAMDEVIPVDHADDEDESSDTEKKDDIPELPDEPTIQLWDVSLESIDSGELKKMAMVAKEAGVYNIDYDALDEDMGNGEWEKIERLYRGMRHREAERHNDQAIIMQWQDSVKSAMTTVTGRIIRMMTSDGSRFEKSLSGDIKKRINRKKKMACGSITQDIDVCKQHYTWIKNLEVELIDGGIPSWLR